MNAKARPADLRSLQTVLKYLAKHHGTQHKVLISNLLTQGVVEVNFRPEAPEELAPFFITAIVNLQTMYHVYQDKSEDGQEKKVIHGSLQSVLQVLSRAFGMGIPHQVKVLCVDEKAMHDIVTYFPTAARKFAFSSVHLLQGFVEQHPEYAILTATQHGHHSNREHRAMAQRARVAVARRQGNLHILEGSDGLP